MLKALSRVKLGMDCRDCWMAVSRGRTCVRWRALLTAVLLLSAAFPSCVSASSFSFGYDVVHRFSSRGRETLKPKIGADPRHWPADNTVDYHQLLYKLDLQRHVRRGLLAGDYYDFSGENTTVQWLASLHYTFVDIGTPSVAFLAALDTGSDLTWFPCDCIQCGNLNDPRISPDLRPSLGIYSPGNSSTSVTVPCSDSMCSLASNCTSATDWCPYEISYLSANTASFGNLVKDVIYLGNELIPTGPLFTTSIYFGCGRRQTGDFINGVAFDGLIGLGYDPVSIPSVLARQGLISNSFSMCISPDGIGRIVFGDKGIPGQPTTPVLAANGAYVTYAIQAISITVGSVTIPAPNRNDVYFFDTGTSYTYLKSNIYQTVVNTFARQVTSTYKRVTYSNIPFEVCYQGSPTAAPPYFTYPSMNFTWLGGKSLGITRPIVYVVDQASNLSGFCLAIINGGDVALFGQNFMNGYRITFDREENVVGWTKTSCYSQTLAANGTAISPTPAPLASPPPSSPPEQPAVPPSSTPPPTGTTSPSLPTVSQPPPFPAIFNPPANSLTPSPSGVSGAVRPPLVLLFLVSVFVYLSQSSLL